MFGAYRIGLVGVLTAVLVTAGGCRAEEAAAEPPPETAALRSAAVKVKEASTLRASFTIKQGAVSTLTGEASVVAGTGMAVKYTYTAALHDSTPKVTGDVLAVDGKAYLRSSALKPPGGKKWLSVDPATPGKYPFPGEWFAMVMARMLDPLFLLDQGLPGVPATARPATVGGLPATQYETSWTVELEETGPEMAAWAKQLDAAAFVFTLSVDPQGRPVALKADSSTGIMQFWADVSYRDYGVDVSVAAPAAGEVSEA